MDFFAQVTAPTKGTHEVVERQHMSWSTGLQLTAGHRASISQAKKSRSVSADHRAKLSQACKTKRAVMTYYGPYPSVMAVARASGRNEETVRSWIRKFPEHYYYIGE